jgi:hypothetical protein
MKRILTAVLLSVCPLVAQVTIQSTQATSKEVVVHYLVPPGYTGSCTIQASYTNDFSGTYTPIPDVDATQFPGSDTDTSRNSKPFVGRSRVVVLGQMIPYWQTLPASATTGFRLSRAIKAASTIYGKNTCGASSATWQATTPTVPFGMTFAEPHPADPSKPGFYNWPSIIWNVKQTIIDPEYGTELKRPDPAGGRAPVVSGPKAFQELSGSGWTNINNILTDDSSSASISASQSPITLPWPYSLLPIGSISQDAASDSGGLDWIQLALKGTNTAATLADGSTETCISVDTGVNCYTPWHSIDLRSCASGCSYPTSPTPVDHWQAPGDRPIPRQWLARRAGNFTYVASTSTVTITSGDHVGEKWTVGTKFRTHATPIQIRNITGGTPITIQTNTSSGLSTSDKINIANVNGTIASAVNGTWTVTVVDATHFTLVGSSGTGTFGRQVPVNSATAGSPPTVYSANSFFANNSLVAMASFTDSGWTSLNGNAYVAVQAGDGEHFTLTGATTTGSYTSGGTMTQLLGTVEKVTDYPIATIVDATHVTLSSGPGSDISTDAPWSVESVAILVRKKTTSADTINIQYASVKTETSPGSSWGAAGGEICSQYTAAGAGGVLGSLCQIGVTPNWIAVDGSAIQVYGYMDKPDSSDWFNFQGTCVGPNAQGAVGVNKNDPARIYCTNRTTTYTPAGYQWGFDQQIIIGQYEGDFTPRPSAETGADIIAAYPGYGGVSGTALDYPHLPNCYGDKKYNDGVNPKIITGPNPRCVSYKVVIPSLQALIAANDTTWTHFVPAISHIPCVGGPDASLHFVYRDTTNSVWLGIACTRDNDYGGIEYAFDLGNELPTSNGSSTVRLAAAIPTWGQTGGRWSKEHGGIGFRSDGYAFQASQPMFINSGVSNTITYGLTTSKGGPFFVDYLSVDGVANAPLTTTLHDCAPWAGSPYLPSPVPDGTGGKGCNTVVVSGEPGDESPDTEEALILAADPATHLAKTGVAGRVWIQDAAVGDITAIDHDADRDYQHVEPATIISKTGNTWVIARGFQQRVNNGGGLGAGVIDHTGDTKRLVMQYNYNTVTGAPPQYFRPYDPAVGTVAMTQGVGMGHGAVGLTLSAGDSGPGQYVAVLGSVARRVAATQPDFTLNARSLPFGGKTSNTSSSTDSHMTFIEPASILNKDPWVLDGAPWNGYSGAGPTGPVSGTTTVYKWLATDLSTAIERNQFPKHLRLAARVGSWVLRDISGPSSVIDDTKPYTVCYVYVANECRSGSTAGQAFAATPLYDQLAGQYQCCGNDYTGLRDFAISASSAVFSRFTQTILRDDNSGRTGRALTSAFSVYRAEDGFKNMSGTSDARLGVLRERGTEFLKSELYTITMPPIIEDGIDRTKFWQAAIPVKARSGADNVLIRFGYQHYGDVTVPNYYCTTRAENCVMGASTTAATNPFWYETTDSYSGVSCASGCTVNLPLIPNRVAYYEIVYRNSTTPVYTTPQQVVVSP